MERTVPSTASEEIELYVRTVYSLLRSTTDVQIRTLEEVHGGMNSSLHPDARKNFPDPSAFIYSLLRLPPCMPQVKSVILAQTQNVFARGGYPGMENWEPVSARARRRRCFFDRKETLACFIASRSDIDDVIPTLTAYQIEWNKLHDSLKRRPSTLDWSDVEQDPAAFSTLAEVLEMSVEDLARLRMVWGADFIPTMQTVAAHKCSLRVRLLSGSLNEYWRATHAWWANIARAFPQVLERPVYFVSSNTHSLANLISGFALQYKDELVAYVEQSGNTELMEEWKEICAGNVPSSLENFLNYVLKKYQTTTEGQRLVQLQREHELACGITRIPAEHSFDVETQVIDLSKLRAEFFDPRINGQDWTFLQCSNALILNIDYPLGLAAYNLLTKIAEQAGAVLGIYVMGKAAMLNGVRGDVMIPNVVQDEHSSNTYLFANAFCAQDVAPFLMYGTVLDNQKSVSVLGTFLQNARIMDVVYREGYTDIEMEAGPFLSAVYEMVRPKRHPVNEIVTLYGAPYDIGILHYASDTPLSKGKNLGAGTLSYFGMDSTYATTLAIVRRILQQEEQRLLEV
ncbi:MAG TPA: hypothetical protein VFF78_08105 [Anaerolineaceae bacterium]|nr:hypothetical protein [Anaerolineaceae bacterium]